MGLIPWIGTQGCVIVLSQSVDLYGTVLRERWINVPGCIEFLLLKALGRE